MYLTICCRDFTLCKSVFTLRLPCGRAVLHKVKTLQRMVGCAMWAELGERVNAEGKMMRGKYLGKCAGSKGKQKSRKAVGLAGRELYFAE